VTEVAITENKIQGKMKVDGTAHSKGERFETVRVDPEISNLLEQYDVTLKGQVESTIFRDLLAWIFHHPKITSRFLLA